MSVAVTCAFGTPAPLGSVAVPMIVPKAAWPFVVRARNPKEAAISKLAAKIPQNRLMKYLLRFTPGSHYELAGPVKHTPLSGWAKLCTDHSPRRLPAKIRMDSIKNNPRILL